MLSARTLHSPQRFDNTIGLVVERTRAQWEMDNLRYHIDGTTDVLFERWMHLTDVVKDLPPIIKEYFESEAHRTGSPTSDSIVADHPYEPDPTVRVEDPIHLQDWMHSQKDEIKAMKVVELYGPPKYKTHVKIHGSGFHNIGTRAGDTFLYVIEGTAGMITDDGLEFQLTQQNTIRIPSMRSAGLEVSGDGYVLSVYMETPHEKPKDKEPAS